MRLSLKSRVVLLVAVFNLLFFAGSMTWSVRRAREERAQQAGIEEELVRESLGGLLLRVSGDRVAEEVLRFPRWDRYEDALLVQLQEYEPRFGLLPLIRSVATDGVARVIPSGLALPLREPPPRTPPSVPWYTLPPHWPQFLPGLRLPWPRSLEPGPVWGAAFITGMPQSAVEVVRGLAFAPLLLRGEPSSDLDPYMESILLDVIESEEPRWVEGGIVLPLRTRGGRLFGAVFSSLADYMLLPLFPARWRERALFVGKPELGFAPTLGPSGLYLNPLGSAHREPGFDEDAVLGDIRRAVEVEDTIENERGLAVPLRLASGEVWGGVWLDPREEDFIAVAVGELFPAFLFSTLFLTIVTFFGMQRLVLDPVRRLASGARGLAEGRLSSRIPETRRRDELSELVRSFNAMAGQVEGFNARLALEVEQATAAAREAEAEAMTQRRLAATGELAAGIAHEINNPLGGLLNALEVLRREDLDPEKRERYLALVEGGLERIRETVGQLLRLAPREMKVGRVRLTDPIGDALGLIRHRASKQGVEVLLTGLGGERPADRPGALDAWMELPAVHGQGNELGQAVLNLLVNALDAMEGQEHARLELGLDVSEAWLHLWVADEGPGMDPDLLPRAADLFFTTKDAGRGTGLGLAIVHNVVATHGGAVRLGNIEGGGFRVDVQLPVEAQA